MNLGAIHKRIVTPLPTRRNDTQFGGPFRVQGTVAIAGTPDVPVSRMVGLFDKRTKRIVRSAWSDPTTGAYTFNYVAYGPWTVISWDHTGEYNAVPADNIFGEAM